MGKQNLTFVLGGAKSGKSEFAESLYSRQEKVCYIATGVVKNPDGEMQLRINAIKSADLLIGQRENNIEILQKRLKIIL